MKLKKGYLTAEELGFIVSEMVNIEGAVNKEILKVGLVAQFVIEDLEEFESCNDIYNKLIETEDINLIYSVHNYDVIDKLVKEELGIDKFMKDFLKGFEKKLDASMQGLDLNSAVKELSKIAEGQPKITTRKKKAE